MFYKVHEVIVIHSVLTQNFRCTQFNVEQTFNVKQTFIFFPNTLHIVKSNLKMGSFT